MTVGMQERPVVAAPARRRSWLARQLQDRERVLLGAVTVVVLLALWEVLARTGVANAAFVSSPSRIWDSLVEYFGPAGNGWRDLAASGQEFAYGFLISVALGVPIGILMGWYHRRLDALLNPIVLFLNTSPRIATAPLFVIWFGLGLESKVWVVVLSAIVPIIVNARAGVVTIEPSLIAMSRSYGNSDLRVLRTVVLPGTVPAISSGLRLGIGHALLGVVLAEFISSTQGLGFVVVSSAATFNTDRLFVAVVLISVLGMLVTGLLGRVEKYFDRWRTA
ncbi:ABC transporter permease [Amycolatopsis pithecellobii]|uniref:ABC transporter permease subunit n=1 Tax=Amycolatopsis pithecellobii TaxID=664692 RepID=A0A6N7YXP9_9PSEU|nr:ABC transporter permease [Amycolatopsis pithecellobii]MTD53119.1 ABC transporter permease subunit [Amycolatopsis pithecellobii]